MPVVKQCWCLLGLLKKKSVIHVVYVKVVLPNLKYSSFLKKLISAYSFKNDKIFIVCFPTLVGREAGLFLI